MFIDFPFFEMKAKFTRCVLFQAFEAPEIAPRSVPFQKELLEEKPTQHQTQNEYDTYDDFEKIYARRPLEISLRMSVGAKKEGIKKKTIKIFCFNYYLMIN